MKYCLLALLILMMTVMSFECVDIILIYTWKYAEYAWDSPDQRKAAEDSGNYDPKLCFLEDLIKADSKLMADYSSKEIVMILYRNMNNFIIRQVMVVQYFTII